MAVVMAPPPRKSWSLCRKLIIGLIAFPAVLTFSIGLGVGLTRGRIHQSNDNSPPSTPSTGSGTVLAGIWQPTNGTTWNYELYGPLSSTSKGDFDVWDIDLFHNDDETISSLQKQGAKVICYFSAGSFEDWAPDKSNFSQSDLGRGLSGWPGEKWLDITSLRVRQIMEQRLDLAAQKNCDGVDPDNIDGYNNDNGLGLTQANSIDYVQFLADGAHQRNLSIGLKNAAEIVSGVINIMQWSVNEQCIQHNECDTFAPFIAQGKPVFHVEYPKGSDANNNIAVSGDARNKICDASSAAGFSTIIKKINLDSWTETCSGTILP